MSAPHWSTSLKTAPTKEPVSLDEAKTHLRVDGTDEDELISALIVAAREVAETMTGRAFWTQTWYLKLDAFPWAGQAIVLPRPPLQSVTSVTYVDTAGTTQTWATADYQIVKPAGPKAQHGSIVPAYAEFYPSTRDQPEAVIVEYVCGYSTVGNGQAVTDVPHAIKAGMLLLIGHWYENREAVNIGNIVTAIPLAVEALLGPYVVVM